MRILQINVTVNSGSTGRIAEEIGNVLLENNHESYIAFGRGIGISNSHLIRIGNKLDNYIHGAKTLLTDKHCFYSKSATKKLIEQIKVIKPDAICLHNLHGYYIQIEVLFDFLKETQIPVLWTLFDAWSFTGHCTYFDDIDCKKWQSHCNNCPKHKNYPSSWVDNSYANFEEKKRIFNSINKMEIVTHSGWLESLVKNSFLKDFKVHVTPSAINLQQFKPTNSKLREKYALKNKKVLLGCASIWTNRKGYADFIHLSEKIDDEFIIVMIGLNAKEIKGLPKKIIGLQRTESIVELAQWYSLAYAFVNPTSQDNFPTTNLEALACGTPVITYNTGGSPEAIDNKTGFVVEKGNIQGIMDSLNQLATLNKEDISAACRLRAELLFDKRTRYLDYLNILEGLIGGRNV
jgi:putative colanic acid biosynthesis glycosyltransferase